MFYSHLDLPRFSLRALMIGVTLLCISFAYASYSLWHGLMALCAIAMGVVWVYEPRATRPPDDPFPWGLFFWTSAKCLLLGPLLAAAMIVLCQPFEPFLERLVYRTLVPLIDPQMRIGAFERLIAQITFGLGFVTLGLSLVFITSMTRNFAARLAAPFAVLVAFVFQIPDMAHGLRDDSQFFLAFLGLGFYASACGWIADKIRERRYASEPLHSGDTS